MSTGMVGFCRSTGSFLPILIHYTGKQRQDHVLTAMQRVLEQSPPIYAPMDFEVIIDSNGHLKNLAKSKISRIVHIQCEEGARQISEHCRNYLEEEKVPRQMLSYFMFNSHDVRFNSLLPMFASFFSQWFYNRATSYPADDTLGDFIDIHHWNREAMNKCWQQLRWDRAISDAVLVLGCFDECLESDAMWFLSQFQDTLKIFDGRRGCMKMAIVTTKGTALDGKIADTLSNMPEEVVQTVVFAHPIRSSARETSQMSRLSLECPDFAEPLATAEIWRLTQMCGQDEGLLKLLYRLIRTRAVPDWPDDRALSSLGSLTEHVFEQLLAQIPPENRDWARRIFAFVLTSLRPLRVHEFHTVSQLCARLDKPSYEPRWLTRGHPSTHHSVVKLLEKLHGLLSIKNDEVHLSHPDLRRWLASDDSSHGAASARPWYWRGSESDGHLTILEISLAHLRDLPDLDSFPSLLPYSIEHWVSHYKSAACLASDRLVMDIFNDDRLLDLWLVAYASLSSPWLQPLPEGPEPLCVAAYFGLDNIVEHFMDHPTSRGETDSWEGALVDAIRTGEASVLQLLLKRAPRPLEFEDLTLQRAVLEASVSGKKQVFWEIVRHIPKSRHPVPQWDTLRRGHVAENATDQVIEHISSNATETGPGDDTPDMPFRWLAPILYRACDSGTDDMVATLLQLGADPESRTQRLGFSALGIACGRRLPSMVKLLLQHGADPEMPSGPAKVPPLGMAAASGSAEVVKLLLETGASVYATDSNGLAPLVVACSRGCFGAAEAILDHIPMHEDLDSYKVNPLLEAVFDGSYKTAEILLQRGVRPDCHNEHVSALGYSVSSGRQDLCSLLLEFGADPDYIPHGSAQPPLTLAVRAKDLDIANLLIRKGADVNKTWTQGAVKRLPMSFAAVNGNLEMTRTLLENGADPNAGDDRGWTPLWLAANGGVIPTRYILY